MPTCTCNFSHYSVMLDDLPDDVNPHVSPCPFADPEPEVPVLPRDIAFWLLFFATATYLGWFVVPDLTMWWLR